MAQPVGVRTLPIRPGVPACPKARRVRGGASQRGSSATAPREPRGGYGVMTCP
jgi:hypothetical protein